MALLATTSQVMNSSLRVGDDLLLLREGQLVDGHGMLARPLEDLAQPQLQKLTDLIDPFE